MAERFTPTLFWFAVVFSGLGVGIGLTGDWMDGVILLVCALTIFVLRFLAQRGYVKPFR